MMSSIGNRKKPAVHIGEYPLCVIITGLDSKHADTITGRKTTAPDDRKRQTQTAVMIVNIAGYNIMPTTENTMRTPVRYSNLKLVQNTTTAPFGCFRIDWSPSRKVSGLR